jgi:hypothetical protein
MIGRRPQADRLLVAELMGEAKHRSQWRELTQAEHDAAAAALAARRTDLLAAVTGLFEGFNEGELNESRARQAAQLRQDARADLELIPGWIEEGWRRAENAHRPPRKPGKP